MPREVRHLGEELYKRLAVFGEHLGRLGKSLGSSVESFNRAVGSLEQQVLPAARRFPDLGLRVNRDIEPIDPVASLARTPRAAALPDASDESSLRRHLMPPIGRMPSLWGRRAIGAGCSLPFEARAPLLGIYALLAEWNALMDPAPTRDAGRRQIGWWQEEIAPPDRRNPCPSHRRLSTLTAPRGRRGFFAPAPGDRCLGRGGQRRSAGARQRSSSLMPGHCGPILWHWPRDSPPMMWTKPA